MSEGGDDLSQGPRLNVSRDHLDSIADFFKLNNRTEAANFSIDIIMNMIDSEASNSNNVRIHRTTKYLSLSKIYEILSMCKIPVSKQHLGVKCRTLRLVSYQRGSKWYISIDEVKKILSHPVIRYPDAYFTIAEYRRYLLSLGEQVSSRTISRWCSQDKIGAVRHPTQNIWMIPKMAN